MAYYVAEQHNDGHPEIYRNGVPTLQQARDLLFIDLQAKVKMVEQAGVRTDVKLNDTHTWYYLRYGARLQNHTEYMILKMIGHP